nr:hypothetical protein [Tanacetum cinerariifolium]
MILKTSSFYVEQGGQLFVCDERAVINVYIAYHKRNILTEIIFCVAVPSPIIVDNGDDDEPVYIGVYWTDVRSEEIYEIREFEPMYGFSLQIRKF